MRWRALVMVAALATGSCGSDREPLDAEVAERPPRNVLLITIDTLRADRLHSYGFAEQTSPNIDRLAARGVLFENAIAAATVTAPAHASIMTSRYVRQHSIGAGNGDTRLEGGVTLAELLRNAGYETAAFVGNIVLRPSVGLDRGFDHYDADLPTPELNRPHLFERNAEGTTTRALGWLAGRSDRPFFLWVHYQDPHGPYTPPDPFGARFERVDPEERKLERLRGQTSRGGIPHYQQLAGVDRASHYASLYAGEIAYADHWIGRLLEAVEQRGAARGTVVLLTADHGESLGENGFYFQHGHATTPELARCPLIVAAPGLAPDRRPELVHHVDVLPTLLDLAGLEVPEDAVGISLAPFLADGTAIPERELFCDIGRETGVYRGDRYLRIGGSVELWGDWASGRTKAQGQPPDSLLVLEAQERGPDGRWRESQTESLTATVRAYLTQRVLEAELPALSEEDEAALRALGYLPPAQDEPKPAPEEGP